MQQVTIDGIDLQSLAAAVGAAAWSKGMSYARSRAVRHMTWSPFDLTLVADVQGSGADDYEVEACFETHANGRVGFVFGDCTCPVGENCKHVAAAVLVAAGAVGAAPAPPVESWEQGIAGLLGASSLPSAGGVSLGVELVATIPTGGSGGPSLQARVVRPGRSGWVVGGLSWGKIAYYDGEFDRAQAGLLRELYALQRAGRPSTYGYSGDDRFIDLTGISARLWPLLEEAADAGVELVHPRAALGPVELAETTEIGLDVTAGVDAGSLTITPALSGVAPEWRPVMFLGNDGHGVVLANGAGPDPAGWQLRLARLAAPTGSTLQRMVLAGRQLKMPSGERARFAREFYPRLRHLAPITSSDGAFEPPSISDPTLVMRADYGAEHELTVSWEWSYEVDGVGVRAPTDAPLDASAYRDPDREQEVLAALPIPAAHTGQPIRLRGLDTMRFTTEVLPLVRGAERLAIEVGGEAPAYREAGDTLRIGVSTSAITGETDWFDLGVSISVEGREVPFVEVFTALAAGESHLLLPDGAYFSLEKPELQSLRALIEEARDLQDTPSGPLRISRFQAGLWAELAALGVVGQQARAWAEQVAGLLAIDEVGATPPPAGLRATMRPYQQAGYEWLCFLQRHGIGGVLADDMGLGKTVQTLAMICQAQAAEPFLIVAPTSVVANWAAEAQRFTPGLQVVAITETTAKSRQDLGELIAGADVVITSYALFRLDAEAYSATGWAGLVLDEAQFVKNHQSKAYQCARRLPAPVKLALTGTPMENNIMELWSLLSITAPGLFPSPTRFKEVYARPIERGGDPELLARLRRRIKPLMLRRTKDQVALDLPAKQVQRMEVELDTRHRRIYQRSLQRERQKVLGLIHDVERNRFTILRSLTLLRQLSLHPGLVEPEHCDRSSSKIEALVEQISDVVAGGHRALVFSQFTGFLGLVRERLDAADVPYSYLDGTTRNRKAVISEFKEGTAPVFLISLKSGGFGLNLTEADYCFLLDPWWNPATEAQAIDRTHRIGQTRNVMVYRMIARDTIEEKVVALADRKAELFRSVIDDGAAFGAKLTAEDIRELIA